MTALKLVVLALYLVGGALTLYGLYGATRRARARHGFLADRLGQVERIQAEGRRRAAALGEVHTPAHTALDEEIRARTDAVLKSNTSYDWMERARQYIERDLLANFAWPARTAGAGVALGTLGSCLSLLL